MKQRTLALIALLPTLCFGGPIISFGETNMVASTAIAPNVDPNLVNPWGVAASAASPFWVADQASAKMTLYNTTGVPQGLVVSSPAAGPTGIVFNGTANFDGDLFISATTSGSITGWRGALGTNAETLLNTPGAMYTGLAIATTVNGTYLYAADLAGAKIDVVPGTGAPALVGNFTDPNLPAGYAPYNIQNLNGLLYVTYAKVNGSTLLTGAGNGIVDVFNTNGTFNSRLITGGSLDTPWGVAIAPNGFGSLGGDLLVGNFGNGEINAYTAAGSLVGTLADSASNPLINAGLHGLIFGNGGNGGNPTSLYLAAGNANSGLFARIDAGAAVPEPGTMLLTSIALVSLIGAHRRRKATLR